jgi:hypothetical protein
MKVYARAADMNLLERQDRLRAHAALAGERILDGLRFIRSGMDSEDEGIRRFARLALAELWEHLGHGCFSSEGVRRIVHLRACVLAEPGAFDPRLDRAMATMRATPPPCLLPPWIEKPLDGDAD